MPQQRTDAASLPVGWITAGWCLLAASFLVHALNIWFANHVALLRVPDDAYYYLEIATRLARGEGFTFDGLHETNGFHPLWQAALVPLAALFDGDGLVRAALGLALTCMLAATLLVARVVGRIAGPGPAMYGAVISTQSALAYGLDGMESAVVVLVLALVLAALMAALEVPSTRRLVLCGLMCAVLVLARIDYAAVVPVVPLALAWRHRSWRPLAIWGAGAALVMGPFLTWWLWRWHHVLTTSATVKEAEMAAAIQTQFGGRLSAAYAAYSAQVMGDYVRRLAPWSFTRELLFAPMHALHVRGLAETLAVVLIALSIGGWAWIGRSLLARGGRLLSGAGSYALVVIGAMLVLKAVVDVTLAPPWAFQWYSAPQHVATGFAAGVGAWIAIERLRAHARAASYVAVAALAVAIPLNPSTWLRSATYGESSDTWSEQTDLAATWIRTHGPAGIYGARDAGLLAMDLDGHDHVVNLDGLVNDYAFAALVARGASLRDRLASTGVDYFVGRLTDDERQRELGCGRALWISAGRIPYAMWLAPYSEGRLYVVDVRGCRTSR